ncbi:LppX_LprAFG lipoprotein [Nocardioides sp. NBC_00850]|uniref:DUF6612 family protein n=1 Tax=Nocardioides sp. NBC_00850 TaxID=2976001 RepID=UPI003870226E|nr:LppX_LprAFG lipoprotein [Nocardioides sp. NBC_00850]
MTLNRTLGPRGLWRRAAVAGVLAVSLSGLVACGGGGGAGGASEGDSISAEEMTEVMKKATDIDTAHFTTKMDAKASGQTVSMTGEGDIQKEPPAQHSTMKMSGGSMNMDLETILVDEKIYIKGMMGDSWVTASTEDLAKMGGTSLESMSNPLAFFEGMEESIKSSKFEGEEKVDGTDTKHYSFTVDSAGLAESLGADSTKGMPKTIDQDIWVDADGLLRKAEVGMGDMGTVEMLLSKHGEDVTIEAPPADQVTDMPSMAG